MLCNKFMQFDEIIIILDHKKIHCKLNRLQKHNYYFCVKFTCKVFHA